ncbi:hypothetical protein ABWH96_19995 [Marivirga tractuosa]|uniref:hypothetical protein n=1 Tax=Marivirga tractuosa TaxID=1006 RepID=UPI0035D044F2
MKNFTKTVLAILIFGFVMSSCGGEEIDACVGASSDPISYSEVCQECCENNGYKRGITSTSGRNRTCKCSGDPD